MIKQKCMFKLNNQLFNVSLNNDTYVVSNFKRITISNYSVSQWIILLLGTVSTYTILTMNEMNHTLHYNSDYSKINYKS